MSVFNQIVFQWIHGLAGRNIIIDDLGVFFANWLPYLMGLGFLLLAAYQPGWKRKLYVFIEGALATILARGIVTEALRFFYFHPRPFDFYGFTPLIPESGSSFPSGHMTFFFALALVVWYVNRTWGAWYLVLSSIVGVARIYVGVHWPLDILGGAAIGLLCGWFVHWLLRRSRAGLGAAPAAGPAAESGAAGPAAAPLADAPRAAGRL